MRPLLLAAIAILGLTAKAHACTNPNGVKAEIIYNTTHNVPIYCDGTNWNAMTGGNDAPYIPNAVNFNTAGTFLSHSTPLTGVTDSNTITFSLWYRPSHIGRQTFFYVYDGSAITTVDIRLGFDNLPRINLTDSSGAALLSTVLNPIFQIGQYYHILVSADLSDTDKFHVYVDDTLIANTPTAYNNGLVAINNPLYRIGSNPFGGDRLRGDLADFWMDIGTYIDLSVEANRRKFIDASGNPVFLGADGSLPTGTAPDIFLTGDTANWHTNKGTGGGFTENGALADAPSTPYTPRTQIVPSGLVGHWRLDETSGTVAADSSGNGRDGTMIGATVAGASRRGMAKNASFFDGVNDHYAIGDISALNMGTSDWAYAIWVKPLGGNIVFGKRANSVGGDGYELRYDHPARKFNAIIGGNSPSSYIRVSNVTVVPDEWYHVAVNIDRDANMTMYVNGVLDSSLSIVAENGVNIVTSSIFNIGGDGGSLNGIVDDVRVYNRILTQAEITEIYEAHDGIRYNANQRKMEYFDGNRHVSMTPAWPDVTNGLVGHWKLDETTGTTAADSTGNGHDLYYDGPVSCTNATNTSSGAVSSSIFMNSGTCTLNSANLGPTVLHNAPSFSAGGWFKVSRVSAVNVNILRRSHDTLGSATSWDMVLDFGGNAGQVDFTVRDTGDSVYRATWNGPYEIGRWHHFMGIKNGTAIELFVDGVSVDTGTFSGTEANSNGSIRFTEGYAERVDYWADDIRYYNRALSLAEVQALYNMGAPVGATTALPQGCATAGQVCDDGTIYAGLSPDGSEEMYVASLNTEGNATWNNGTANWIETGFNDLDAGEANTNSLAVATDIGAPYEAALYCYNIFAHGLDDWYLPSRNELDLVYSGGVYLAELQADEDYWTSSENTAGDGTDRAILLRDNGTFGSNAGNKNDAQQVRCVRKGPAPRCANPYGLEGQLTYNTTEDVAQYCDGARWIAIGKTGP